LLVLPSDTPGRVLLARVTPKTELAAPPPKEPIQFTTPVRPTAAAAKPAKKWWQRRSA
jgi:hypothetical protein